MPTDTYMQARCPNPECGRQCRVKAEFWGKTATCEACGKPFVLVPTSASAWDPVAGASQLTQDVPPGPTVLACGPVERRGSSNSAPPEAAPAPVTPAISNGGPRPPRRAPLARAWVFGLIAITVWLGASLVWVASAARRLTDPNEFTKTERFDPPYRTPPGVLYMTERTTFRAPLVILAWPLVSAIVAGIAFFAVSRGMRGAKRGSEGPDAKTLARSTVETPRERRTGGGDGVHKTMIDGAEDPGEDRPPPSAKPDAAGCQTGLTTSDEVSLPKALERNSYINETQQHAPSHAYIQVRCPNPACGREYRVKAEFSGRTVTCKGCNRKFAITLAPATAPAAPVGGTHRKDTGAPRPVRRRSAPSASTNLERRVLTITLAGVGVIIAGLGTWLFLALRAPTAAREPNASVASLVAPHAEIAAAPPTPFPSEKPNSKRDVAKAQPARVPPVTAQTSDSEGPTLAAEPKTPDPKPAKKGTRPHTTKTVVRAERKPAKDTDGAVLSKVKMAITDGAPEDLLALLKSDYSPTIEQIRWGLYPWFVFLEDEKESYTTVPGGRLHFGIDAVWVNPKSDGQATATAFALEPKWETAPGGNSSGWFLSTEGKNINFIAQKAWVLVPDDAQLGSLTVKVSTDAEGPPDERGDGKWTAKKAYNLVVAPWPLPDREAILCIWAYAINEGRKFETYPNGVSEETKNIIRWADQLLDGEFREYADPSVKTLLQQLLHDSEYTKQVKQNLSK